jgi:hypothetical protein
MKWMPAKLGAEPKKTAILGALALVLLYLLWTNLFSGGGSPQSAASTALRGSTPYANVAPEGSTPEPVATTAAQRRPAANTRATSEANLEDFKPSMKRARLIASDPTKVDPTLRLDLLAKLQDAKFEGSTRSIFEFSQAPPLPVQEPKRIIPGPLNANFIGPRPLEAPKPPPPPPPPPPISLKFYGFVNPARPDIKRAFFLDGEDILVAGEGETIHNRYRIVHIGVNSATVEDIQYKNQQPLPLVDEEKDKG